MPDVCWPELNWIGRIASTPRRCYLRVRRQGTELRRQIEFPIEQAIHGNRLGSSTVPDVD